MEKKDWTLLAIAAGRGVPVQPIQLQKSLFLLGQERASFVPNFYRFEAYNWGPFDKAIFEDAEKLEREGLIRIIRFQDRTWKEYLPTEEGTRKARELATVAPPKAVEYLRLALEWTRSLSFPELLSEIYKQYPSFKANSLFRDAA